MSLYEKKYKDAQKWIESIYTELNHKHQMEAEAFFPELKESEDERIRKWCISHFRECFRVTKDNVEYKEYLNNKVIPWLEKQGEQKPAWSEEDETRLTNTIIMLKEGASLHFNKKDITKAVEWLKSLRLQNRWKPSDEQIKVCKEVYADILSAKGFDLGTVNSELNRMEEELKKLKQ